MCGICFSAKQSFFWCRHGPGNRGDGSGSNAPATTTASATVSTCPTPHGVITEFPVVPCPTAGEDALRAVTLHDCRRCYVAPSLEALRSAGGSTLFMKLLDNIRRRGPETFGATRRVLDTGACVHVPHPRVHTKHGDSEHRKASTQTRQEEDNQGFLSMRTDLQGVSAVLGLRGHATVHQPFEMEVETDLEDDEGRAAPPVNKSFLLWNGEIFNGSMCPPPWGSDTIVLASRLSQLEQECVPTSEADSMNFLPLRARQELFLARCVQAFEEEVQGPYGFLFYANQLQLAVFGRDPLGRHSLLAHLDVHQPAVAVTGASREVPALEVELLISSVGVQHAKPGTCREGGDGDGDRKRSRPAAAGDASSGSADPKTDLQQSVTAASKSRLAGKAEKMARTEAAHRGPSPKGASDEASHGGGTNSSYKGSKNVNNQHHRNHNIEEDEDDDDDDDDERSGCWLELPVTGLFALPLDRPLVNAAAALSTSCCTSSEWETGRASIPIQSLAQTRGLLLHCPWRDRYHLVHPLLRAFTTAAPPPTVTAADDTGKEQAQALPVPAAHLGGAAGDGLPNEWVPPPRPLLFQPTDTVPALPPMLAEWVAQAAPVSGTATRNSTTGDEVDEEDAVWAHWAATCYLHALAAAVQRRTDVAAAGAENTRDWASFGRALRRPLCVLFSGGIDCTVLAALAHCILPLETPIELVNVAFGENPAQAPDRIAALRAVGELVRLPQPPPHPDARATAESEGWQPATEREWRLVLVDVPAKQSAETEHIKDLVAPRHTVMDLDIGTALWHAARGAGRMQVLRRSDLVVAPDDAEELPTGVGDPNSGAADVARALRDFNKHVRIAPAAKPSTKAAPSTPAAIAATSAPESPADKFQVLIEVLVSEGRQGDGPAKPVLLSTLGKEYGAYLQPHLAAYGYRKMGAFLNDAYHAGIIAFDNSAPSKAVLLTREEDKRRATPPPPCRWFVTPRMQRERKEQQQEQQEQKTARVEELLPPTGTFEMHYVSKAKVLLLGMGADETLGGYTRYRRFFSRHGMRGTQRELEKDFARLWKRNLGRDDRITMDSGREPRFPYLDEELLMTLEKIVAERRRALLAGAGVTTAGNGALAIDTSSAAPAEHEKEEAKLLQTSLEPVMCFRLPPGQGDKRVLRRVAAIIGLHTVTRLQKRAIQFGARVADRRVSGTTEL